MAECATLCPAVVIVLVRPRGEGKNMSEVRPPKCGWEDAPRRITHKEVEGMLCVAGVESVIVSPYNNRSECRNTCPLSANPRFDTGGLQPGVS
jgi:hypothetical protein